jgi:hypothetical protein
MLSLVVSVQQRKIMSIDPTPFVWTTPAETILAKLRRLPELSD